MNENLRTDLLGRIKRLEELVAYPVGHAGAWQEAQSLARSLSSALPSGMAGDLATKIEYAVGYVVESRLHQEDRERGKLTDYLWRLRATIEAMPAGDG